MRADHIRPYKLRRKNLPAVAQISKIFHRMEKIGRCIAMPIIYLSPSTQDWNQYVNGGTEEEWMNLLADKMVPMLDLSLIHI